MNPLSSTLQDCRHAVLNCTFGGKILLPLRQSEHLEAEAVITAMTIRLQQTFTKSKNLQNHLTQSIMDVVQCVDLLLGPSARYSDQHGGGYLFCDSNSTGVSREDVLCQHFGECLIGICSSYERFPFLSYRQSTTS